MDLRNQVQTIKAQYESDMQREDQLNRRNERFYHDKLSKHIVSSIMKKRVNRGHIIIVQMRMDRERKFCVEEINALLSQNYVKVRSIDTFETELNELTINPPCICCCPCLSLPKLLINYMFGTLYRIRVYLDV